MKKKIKTLEMSSRIQKIKRLTWNIGRLINNSPKIQPQDQTSIEGPYRSSPSRSSGGRYHNVMTLLVYGLDRSSAFKK